MVPECVMVHLSPWFELDPGNEKGNTCLRGMNPDWPGFIEWVRGARVTP